MSINFILDDGQQFILTDPITPEQINFGAPNLNTFIRASITLLNVADGTTTTIKLINREVDSDLDCFPILHGVSNVGLKQGAYVPEASRSAIELNNTANSFGSERRFSDLLQRYTIVEQEIKIHVAQIPLNKTNLQETDFVLKWKAIGTNVAYDGSKCQILMSRSDIDVRSMTYIINSDDLPDAPSSSLGKSLPIIIGDSTQPVEVEAVKVSEMVDGRITYLYATTLGATHVLEYIGAEGNGEAKVLMENRSREWQEMYLPRWNAFFLNGNGTFYRDIPHAYSYNGTWAVPLKEVAYKLTPSQNITAGQVLVGIDWYLSSAISGDFYNFQPAKFTLKVYSEWNNYPDELIAQDTIDCEVDYATKMELVDNVGTATYVYKFKFHLNKPIIAPENSSIYISLHRDDITEAYPQGVFQPIKADLDSGGVALPYYEQYYTFNSNAYLKVLQTQNSAILDLLPSSPEKTALQATLADQASTLVASLDGWQFQAINVGRDHFQLYSLTILPTSANPTTYQNGLGYRGFTLVMRSEQETPDLSNLRLLTQATGLQDDTNGTITGTPSNSISSPLHVARMLTRQWNGSAWVDYNFDHTKFNDTHYQAFDSAGRWAIKLSGATQGRTLLREILISICENSMSQLVSFVSETNYSIGLFAYGTKRTRTAVLDDENARLLGAEIGGIDTVVNHIQGVYNRTVQARTEEILSEGGLKQYQLFYDSENTPADMDREALAISQSRWGIRPLRSINFDFIKDANSIKSVAGLILRQSNSPDTLFRVLMPLSECPDLIGMDIVDIKFVNLPAYYGSTHKAKRPMAGTENATVDLINGHYWKRAQTYRCVVIGNELILKKGEPIQHLLTLKRVDKVMIL